MTGQAGIMLGTLAVMFALLVWDRFPAGVMSQHKKALPVQGALHGILAGTHVHAAHPAGHLLAGE